MNMSLTKQDLMAIQGLITTANTQLEARLVEEIDKIETSLWGKFLKRIDEVEASLWGKFITRLDRVETSLWGRFLKRIDKLDDDLSVQMENGLQEVRLGVGQLKRVQQAEMERNDRQDRLITKIRKILHAI